MRNCSKEKVMAEALSKAAKIILARHPKHTKIEWWEVKRLFEASLLGDIIQDDPAIDLAHFRGPLSSMHVGAEKIIFGTTWVVHRPFPTDGFMYTPRKLKFCVPAAGEPWIQDNGAISCPWGGREATLLCPKEDAFPWRHQDLWQLRIPEVLWARSHLLHSGAPAPVVNKVIPLPVAPIDTHPA